MEQESEYKQEIEAGQPSFIEKFFRLHEQNQEILVEEAIDGFDDPLSDEDPVEALMGKNPSVVFFLLVLEELKSVMPTQEGTKLAEQYLNDFIKSQGLKKDSVQKISRSVSKLREAVDEQYIKNSDKYESKTASVMESGDKMNLLKKIIPDVDQLNQSTKDMMINQLVLPLNMLNKMADKLGKNATQTKPADWEKAIVSLDFAKKYQHEKRLVVNKALDKGWVNILDNKDVEAVIQDLHTGSMELSLKEQLINTEKELETKAQKFAIESRPKEFAVGFSQVMKVALGFESGELAAQIKKFT